MNYKILVVDDEPANLRMLERVFRGQFEVICAGSGAEGLELLMVHDIALIISDQRMPVMSGVDFLMRAAEMRPHCVRIILTGYTDSNDLAEALNSNVVYKYITKPWVNSDLLQTVKRGLSHHETIKAQHRLNLENQRLKERLDFARNGLLLVLARTLSFRFENASEHSARRREIAESIGQALDLDSVNMTQLSIAAQLHDIVYLEAPDELLDMSRQLSEAERVQLADHRESGLELLTGTSEVEDAAAVIRYTDERHDGAGVPDGLTELQIPLKSRILAVAAAYERMTRKEPSGYGMSDAEATEMLQAEAGRRYDPNIVSVFCGFQAQNQIRGMIPAPLSV